MFTLLILTSVVSANSGPITVKANEHTTVSLFFPSAIEKVIEPASHFNFTHEKAGNLATLRAKKGKASNLTVIIENGDIFSFVLYYSETIENFTYVISSTQAIGNRNGTTTVQWQNTAVIPHAPERGGDASKDASQRPFRRQDHWEPASEQVIKDTFKESLTTENATAISELSEENYIEQGSFYDMDREGYYEIFCENSYLQRTITKNNVRENGGVDLRLNHMAVDHNEIYFTLQFRNVSKSDYHIDKVRFYIQSLGNEEIPMSPLYTYKLGGLIKQSGVNKFVYVFQDFKLGPEQRVYVVMDERGGHRNIILPLDMEALRKGLE
ncbi:MAG: DUF4138 domain-containing protein [Pricia sp.]